MSNENTTIHDFDFNIICDYFSALKRQGPGSPEMTLKALSFIDPLAEHARITDIGCGTGGQTMVLAQHTPGTITGIDLSPQFIGLFNRNAAECGLQNRLKGITGNMEELPFQTDSLDLIWCEGAIYNIGFEKGLSEWRHFLKPGGYIAVTEACWFTDIRPDEIDKFWNDAYPGIGTIPVKVAQMQAAGYIPVATFILPDNCWTDHFFVPQEGMQDDFLKRYNGSGYAASLVEEMRNEALMYEKYGAYYGYVFFIGKKLVN
ncbi:MAG TPA: class I SAM-dependent methyltransferase [Bacteroidales bacterium]|nr:class I SAM-dependent methyltransferase [Bacteroidales bacterium]HRZ49657.1 class I SAM-dependent methyltransferase [Bacteroidales bacterium]